MPDTVTDWAASTLTAKIQAPTVRIQIGYIGRASRGDLRILCIPQSPSCQEEINSPWTGLGKV